MTFQLTADQQALFTASFRDANNGEIGPPDADQPFGPFHPQPFWTEDSKGTIIKLVSNVDDPTSADSDTARAIDGYSCLVEGVAPGTATLTCTDRGTGKFSTEMIVVSPGGIASVSISAGVAVRKPAELAEPGPLPDEVEPPLAP